MCEKWFVGSNSSEKVLVKAEVGKGRRRAEARRGPFSADNADPWPLQPSEARKTSHTWSKPPHKEEHASKVKSSQNVSRRHPMRMRFQIRIAIAIRIRRTVRWIVGVQTVLLLPAARHAVTVGVPVPRSVDFGIVFPVPNIGLRIRQTGFLPLQVAVPWRVSAVTRLSYSSDMRTVHPVGRHTENISPLRRFRD